MKKAIRIVLIILLSLWTLFIVVGVIGSFYARAAVDPLFASFIYLIVAAPLFLLISRLKREGTNTNFSPAKNRPFSASHQSRRNPLSSKKLLRKYREIEIHRAKSELGIVQDCLYLVESSTNWGTIVSRYNVLLDVYDRMCLNPDIFFDLGGVDVLELRDNATDNKSVALVAGIKRAWEKEYRDASMLKTERGQLNRINKFLDSLDVGYKSLPPDVQGMIDDLRYQFNYEMQK